MVYSSDKLSSYYPSSTQALFFGIDYEKANNRPLVQNKESASSELDSLPKTTGIGKKALFSTLKVINAVSVLALTITAIDLAAVLLHDYGFEIFDDWQSLPCRKCCYQDGTGLQSTEIEILT